MVFKYCSVKYCYNGGEDKGRTYFMFPRGYNESRRKRAQKWADFCGDPELTAKKRKNYKRYICDIHFEEKDFVCCTRMRLHKNAMPKLFGPNAELCYVKESPVLYSSVDHNKNNNFLNSLPVLNTIGIASVEDSRDEHTEYQSETVLGQVMDSDVMMSCSPAEDCVAASVSNDDFEHVVGNVCSGYDTKETLENSIIVKSNTKNLTNISIPVVSSPKSETTLECLQRPFLKSDIKKASDSSISINEHRDFVEYTKSNQALSGLVHNEDDDMAKDQNTTPQVFTKDFHFCGECQKLFDSFDQFLVHKLKDEGYKMLFSQTDQIHGLWLPRLSKKTAADSESEDSDAEEPLGGWITAEDAKSQHVCKFCGLFFETGLALKVHQDHVHLDKPYACSECPVKFKNKGSMVRHYFRTHQELR